MLSDVDITENDKLNVQKLEHEFSQITNNYDLLLNQPTIPLTRIDLSEHGIYIYLVFIRNSVLLSCFKLCLF